MPADGDVGGAADSPPDDGRLSAAAASAAASDPRLTSAVVPLACERSCEVPFTGGGVAQMKVLGTVGDKDVVFMLGGIPIYAVTL